MVTALSGGPTCGHQRSSPVISYPNTQEEWCLCKADEAKAHTAYTLNLRIQPGGPLLHPQRQIEEDAYNSVILMEILLQPHRHGIQLATSHAQRDFNTWADELTHPDFHGFTPDLQLPVERTLWHFTLVRSILVDTIFD